MRGLSVFLVVVLLFNVFVSVQSQEEEVVITEEFPGTVEETPFTEDKHATEVVSNQEFIDINVNALKGGKEHAFETDINQLLGIIINSLYTNKDIFLRELISNASDALDKIRFKSLLNQEELKPNKDMEVYIKAYPEERKIVIRDDGIGMTESQLISELGTIARSGTKYFIEEYTKSKEAALNLIGQFGVGFYSSFLVAEKVVVVTKHNEDPVQHVWVSTADGSFEIFDDPRGNTLGRGTEIILYLKEGMDKYLNTQKLRELVEHYSEFVPYPINMWLSFEKEVPASEYDDYLKQNDFVELTKKETEEEEEETVCIDGDCEGIAYDDEEPLFDEEDEEEEEEFNDEDEEVEILDDEEEDDEEELKNVRYSKWKVINQNQPLWTRNPKEIYKEEYQNFYKSNVRKNGMWNPLTWTHFSVEGNIVFSAILYIPKKHPDAWMPHNSTDGITLYVRRVMIQNDVPHFLPRYLSFITGVVDSNDLPLHISRELLQKNKLLTVIKKKLQKKIFELIKKLARDERAKRIKEENERNSGMLDRPLEEPDEEAYPFTKFWQDWGINIRAGIIEDEENRDELVNLLRYFSTKSEDELTSLEEYVTRMPENQEYIYYVSGENFEKARSSPFLEKAKEFGFEVLYFTDAIDQYMINHVNKYAGFKLVSVTDSSLKFGDEVSKDFKKKWKKIKKEFKPLVSALKSLLGSEIQDVKLGRRLSGSMAVVTAPKHAMNAYQYNLAKMQANKKGVNELNKMMMKQRVLEINPYHDVVRKMLAIVKNNKRDKIARKMMLLMFDTALIRSGYDLSSNSDMSERISDIMNEALKDQEILEDREIDVDNLIDVDIDEEEFDEEFEDFEEDEDFEEFEEEFEEKEEEKEKPADYSDL